MSPVNSSTGCPDSSGLPADPGHTVVAIAALDGRLRGHRIIAADTHLQLPVVALGERDQIGVGVLALGDLGLHLLAGLGGQLHGLLGLQQGVLEEIIEPGIGALQDQRRQRGNGGARRNRHGGHHAVDPGADVVQGVGDRRDGIELAAAIAHPQLGRTAERYRRDRRVRRH